MLVGEISLRCLVGFRILALGRLDSVTSQSLLLFASGHLQLRGALSASRRASKIFSFGSATRHPKWFSSEIMGGKYENLD